MVSTTHARDKLGTSQSTINDRPQQQQQQQQQLQQLQQQQSRYYQNQYNNNSHHHHHHYTERQGITNYRSGQTAQDKRSRLSNVINNLRKKVPTESSSAIATSTTTATTATIVHDCRRAKDTSQARVENSRNDEDEEARNSVERNLANLEKYVMTVLNGVIKDAESKDESKNEVDRTKIACDTVKIISDAIDSSKIDKSSIKDNEDPQSYSPEPSKPNESRVEAAVPGTPENPKDFEEKRISNDANSDNEILEVIKRDSRLDNDETRKISVDGRAGDAKVEAQGQPEIERSIGSAVESARFQVSPLDGPKSSSALERPQDGVADAILSNYDDKRSNRSLGTLILDRLDHQIHENATELNSELRNNRTDPDSDSNELRSICRDLLNELLNDITQLIDETPLRHEDKSAILEVKIDEVKEAQSLVELSNTSIQCSLPLDKVASMLQNCQTPTDAILSACATLNQQQQTSKTPVKPPSPTIRHLCLYCDRKFLSISLRQRHTDRVHQSGGGRRSERNSRKTTQNCQYCADKCADNLDSLFQHMIVKHSDKYHACVQCTTRYTTRDNLVIHMSDIHGFSGDKTLERCEKSVKENLTFKEPAILSSRETNSQCNNERRADEETEKRENETHQMNQGTRGNPSKEVISNPASPEFDSSFYSSVSCNIRENLLHHLDGKLQICTSPPGGASSELKSQQPQTQQQQQTCYDHSATQIQFPIDISLTAATPVDSKEYVSDEYENSSEYAQKPGKTGRSHPRRVSFEKYNFPRKYDGKEQWTCSIKDLSKFDISTQLTLRKKQQLIKERLGIGRTNSTTVEGAASTESFQTKIEPSVNENCTTSCESLGESRIPGNDSTIAIGTRTPTSESSLDNFNSEDTETSQTSEIIGLTSGTEFTAEFGNFLRLKKWNECNVEVRNKQVVYAELTGEWSRPRVYICGACSSKHVTLREMEEHKATSHPNVWCSHLEFTGDQRELYKHLFLPGRCVATNKAKNAILLEKVCTKCSKICGSLAELHRHMLECGGDQAWLLGLFGNGKKKCKWRPFGSRSRRRRQRGMKRNIQNSQTPRVNQPRERNSSGPRVRPSDRESIQKMLANLPPKRASRRVMQETTVRTQGRLRKMQTRSRPRLVDPALSSSRLSRKAVLRNKLLKNAKSFQRKRCRGDNITASIECVVKNNEVDEYVDVEGVTEDDDDEEEADEEEEGEEEEEEEEEAEEEEEEEEDDEVEDDSGRVFKESRKFESTKSRGETSRLPRNLESSNRSTKIVRGVRVVSKKRNVKSKDPRNGVVVKSRVIVKKRGVVGLGENAKNTKNTKIGEKIGTRDRIETSASTPSHAAISRRKKHVDPVVSLHASLKARSQLRTHDGKFARKPVDLKVARTSGETRKVIAGSSQLMRTRRQEPKTRLETRARLRPPGRPSNDAKVTRRSLTKKNAAENEKITNAESAKGEKVTEEKGTNVNSDDFSSKREESDSTSSEKSTSQSGNAEIDLDDAISKNIIDVTQIKNLLQNNGREQRPTRGRRKKIVEDVKTSENDEISTTIGNSTRESRTKNRSLPSRASSSTDYSEESSRRATSKDSKSREVKEDGTGKKNDKSDVPCSGKKIDSSKSMDTRRTRQERRTGSLEDFSKIRQVPDEVKKLLGPSDDLTTQIGLKTRDKGKKVNSKQGPKSKTNSPKNKVQKKNIVDEEKIEESLEGKTGLRKSLRNAERREAKSVEEKKNEDSEERKIAVPIDEILLDESNDSEKIENSLGKRRGRIKSKKEDEDDESNVAVEKKDEKIVEISSISVEKIGDKKLEESVEVVVDKKCEKSVEQIVDEDTLDSIEKIVDEDTLDSIEKIVNENPEESLLKIVDANLEQSIEKIVNINLEESIKKIVNINLAESMEKIVNTNLEESIQKIVKTNLQIVNENLEKSIEKIVDNGTEGSIGSTLDTQPGESTKIVIDKNPEKSIDVAVNKNLDESIDMTVRRNFDESMGIAFNKTPEKLIGITPNRYPEERIPTYIDKNLELSIEKLFTKKIDQSIVSKHLDESIELAIMKNLEDPIETFVPKTPTESIESIVPKSLEKSIESIVSQSVDEPIEPVDKKLDETIEIINIDDDVLDSSSKCPSDVATLSFEHLQQESNNSNIDSGKENSSETPVNISKLKVVRPKKSRGLRRDRMGKRTLSNVIGILTEGVNIPVEIQQSVVLTVQTAIEATSDTGTQNNPSQISGSSAASGEASNVRPSVKPNEITDAACSSTDNEELQISQEMEKLEIEKLAKSENDDKIEKIDKTEIDGMENTTENIGVVEHPGTNVQQPEVQRLFAPVVAIAAPLPVEPIETVQSTANEPTNDIILDLSRRKPKGKGSFLEKIVSKIAKKKDALLEGDVGCLLDSAADELTNILSEVSPPLVEPQPPKIEVEKIVTTIIPQEPPKKEEKIIIPLKMIIDEITRNKNEIRPFSMQTNVNKTNDRSEKEVQPSEEQTLGTGIIPTFVEEFSAAPESTACPMDDREIVTTDSKRTSKKRSLDVPTPKKNKRKTVGEEEPEEDSSEEEMCLADIMKLINRTRPSTPKNEEKSEKIHPGKRKIVEVDMDDDSSSVTGLTVLSTDSSGEKIKLRSNGTEIKKSKRNGGRKSQISEDSSLEPISNDEKIDDWRSANLRMDKSSESVQSCPEDLSTSSSTVKSSNKEKIKIPTESRKIDELPVSTGDLPVASVEETSRSRPTRKCTAKKRSLADEHLDLSDEDDFDEIFPRTIQEIVNNVAVPSDSTSELCISSIANESFKVPDFNEFLTTRKGSSRKKFLADNSSPIDIPISPKNILPVENVETARKFTDPETPEMDCDDKKSEDAMDAPEEKFPIDSATPENDEMPKIEDTIRCESVENDDPEITKISRKRNLVEEEEEEEKESNDETQDTTEDENESEGNGERRRSLTRRAKETSMPEDSSPLSDAKLQRKFAVVHTKSGKMLIVEKKKKFTKEAAKFFCEVCAASFTRKSSLKKHNSSQSHQIQIAKYCEGAEKIETPREDVTLEVDRSDDFEKIVSEDDSKDPLGTSVEAAEESVDEVESNKKDETIAEATKEPEEKDRLVLNDKNRQEDHDDSLCLGKQPEVNFEEEQNLEDDLEDELLDEEICKITENMTHDEYVLTDHVSPVVPEASSTPTIDASAKIVGTPDSIKKLIIPKIDEKTRDEEESKMNLADEHLSLDSPITDEILSRTTITNVSSDCPEQSSILKLAIKIPEPTMTIESPIEKTEPEVAEEKWSKEAEEPIEVKVDSRTSSGKESMIEKSSKSRRKSKKTVEDRVSDFEDIFVPEVKENEDSLVKESENKMAEVEESKSEEVETFPNKQVFNFSPQLPEDFKQPVKLNSPMVLDFSNITEKLRPQQNSTKDISHSIEFDSDDETSDTNMSNDIRKILDDPELDTDNRQTRRESKSPIEELDMIEKKSVTKKVDVLGDSIVASRKSKPRVKSEESNGKREKPVKKSSRGKNSSKETLKKSKTTKPRRSNTSTKGKMDDSSESEYDEQKDVLESQNKSKIVKCVFGRVFGGEKIDKVKEVLEDWVSRSEGDSHDETQTSVDLPLGKIDKVGTSTISPTGSRRSRKDEEKSSKVVSRNSSRSPSPSRGRGKKRGRSKNGENRSSDERRSRSKSGTQSRKKNGDRRTTNETITAQSSNDLRTTSRCRQSKKRAEERISRAFEDESSIPFDESELLSQLNSTVTTKISSSPELPRENPEVKSMTKKQSTSSKHKKRSQDDDAKSAMDSDESLDERISRTSLNCPSTKKGRSRSPDENSRKIESLTEDVLSEVQDDEDEDEIALGRLSPLYVCNIPESSMDSSSNSEDEENVRNVRENRSTSRGRGTGEFINEKLVPASPKAITSNRDERNDVVTIVPNDAIEDNALDVPRDAPNSPSQKSRQGKVLNFDEELFVECCSRLKATTENELRGAKKIKLDHTEAYERNDEQEQAFRGSRDRWRDVESQNSLGSLLESVNQLLGEEMYSGGRANEFSKRGRNNGSERSSRTASPDVDANRQENLGYEDSLDVAFEHNNKLRVKIQQRMRESENLIASTFGQKTSGSMHRHHHHHHHHHHHRAPNHQRHHENSHNHRRDNRQLEQVRKEQNDRATIVNENLRNDENYGDRSSDKTNERSNVDQSEKHVELDCSGFRSKNPALGGLLDNLLHRNGKHDHNGSTPMNVLAELACARVPTSTIPELNSSPREKSGKSPSRTRESSCEERPMVNKDVVPKKPRNPIRELFERKKEINERKHHERIESSVALKELNVQRQKKSKKPKKQQQQDFPLIRKSQLGGMVEKKKRRDDRKIVLDSGPERIKDIYDFDDDESQQEPSSVLSYRNKIEKSYEIANCARTKELDMTGLMTKTIGETLKNGKSSDALGRRLESMIDRKFQEIETLAPKTKGALKSFQMEEKQQQQQQAKQEEEQRVSGPMDDFIERKQRSRKLIESSKHGSRSKRRSKNSKKKSRNAWYENDSSDEFRTAAKAEDVGVGISKSQRTCSKGKQNLFAELTTSSESEYENEDVDYEGKRRLVRGTKKIEDENCDNERMIVRASPELADNYPEEHEDRGVVDWMNVSTKTDSKNEPEHKKSESEMSDHPLIIDERKIETDETRNSDDDTETRYVPAFELDDLYREDSSVADDTEEETNDRENEKVPDDAKLHEDEEIPRRCENEIYGNEKELIPLEEALDLLDNNEDLPGVTERIRPVSRCEECPPRITSEAPSQEKDEIDEDIENDCEPYNEEREEESELPEKLSSNEKPQKESDNLPLHVFLSRKVQESKKRKQQQAKKLQEEQDRILMDFQPTRRQRKCAIGKQGLLAEISSSDEESYARETCRRIPGEKTEERQTRKPKRESKEKRKERYMEKKHEQIIAKEQKAIEEEILRELEKTKGSSVRSDSESSKAERNITKDDGVVSGKSESEENESPRSGKKKRQQKSRKSGALDDSRHEVERENSEKDSETLGKTAPESKSNNSDENLDVNEQDSPTKLKKQSKSAQKKKSVKSPETKSSSANRKSRTSNSERTNKNGPNSTGKDSKERRSSSGKRDSDDEELRTTKCWNKVDEGVGVAIGRRKRAAANQLYYWSSSSDDDEPIPAPTPVVEEEDDRQEQHGWIVGDSHKRMITMLAMEKQLKEKRRRSEDEFEPGKTKNKKHRNSTS